MNWRDVITQMQEDARSDERVRLGQAVLDLMTGVSFHTALAAQCDALATGVGATFYLSGKSRDEAEAFMRALAVDMVERHIRLHWGAIQGAELGQEGHA